MNTMKAFPTTLEQEAEKMEGMDLRDYFAAKSLPLIPFMANEVFMNPETWAEKEIAEEAYRLADAMMEARK